MNNNRRYLIFIIVSCLFFLLAEWLSVFPHEFGHSTVAWLYGFKANPLDIYYGGWNWQNILFVTGIDENVNYYLIYLAGHRPAIGLIALGGVGITIVIYVSSLLLISLQKIKRHPYLYYFLCWINFMNLTELVSYFILRSFSAHGDIANMEFAWRISPWWFFIVGGGLLVIGIWHFFSNILIELYVRMRLEAVFPKVVILSLFAFLLFGQSGIRMFLYSYGSLATALGWLFCILVPMTIILCWPTRKWLRNKLGKFN